MFIFIAQINKERSIHYWMREGREGEQEREKEKQRESETAKKSEWCWAAECLSATAIVLCNCQMNALLKFTQKIQTVFCASQIIVWFAEALLTQRNRHNAIVKCVFDLSQDSVPLHSRRPQSTCSSANQERFSTHIRNFHFNFHSSNGPIGPIDDHGRSTRACWNT